MHFDLRHAPIFVFFLAATLAGAGCSNVGSTNPYDPEAPESVQAKATLSGTVRSSGNTVVTGATVAVTGTALTAVVDDLGAFSVTNVPAGLRGLTVQLDCHQTLTVPPLSVGIGATIDVGALTLSLSTGSVSGTVGIEGNVELDPSAIVVRNPLSGATAVPNAALQFTLAGVPTCEDQRLEVSAPGFVTATSPTLEVSEGESTTLADPIVLVPLPAYVRGRVVMPADSVVAVSSISVELHDRSGTLVTATPSAEDGTFSAQVTQGAVSLVVSGAGFVTARLATYAPPAATPDGATDVGEIHLAYAVGNVRGTLSLADDGDATTVSVTLVDGPTTATTRPGADGRYSFAAVRGGTYRISATAFGYEAGTTEPFEVLEGPATPDQDLRLDVRPGVLCGRLVFPLSPGEAPAGHPDTVDCPALDPQAMSFPDASVVLPTAGALTATVQADGYFRLTPRAGFHTVELRRDGFESVIRFNVSVSDDPDSPTDLGQIALDFARGGLTGTVQLEDCPDQDVLATVVTNHAREARVLIISILGQLNGGSCPASTNWELPLLPVGQVSLTISAPDYFAQAVEGTVEERRRVVLDAPTILPINGATLRLTVGAEGVNPLPDDVACEGLDPALIDTDLLEIEVTLVGTETTGHPDCHGAVELTDLRPNTYAVAIGGGQSYDLVLVPTVTLASGRETDLGRIELPYARGQIEGRVITSDGLSPENTLITLNGPSSAVAYANGDGDYQFFGVRTGSYSLQFNLYGYATEPLPVTVVRDVVSETGVITLALNPGAIMGRILPEGGGVFGGTSVQLAGGGVSTLTSDGVPDGQLPGAFLLENIRAGTHALEIARDGRFRRTSVPNIQVVPGLTVQLGEIPLPRARGAVSLSVTLEDTGTLDADTIERVFGDTLATLDSLDDGENVRFEARADASGRVVFPSVQVGRYTLTLAHDDYDRVEQIVAVSQDEEDVELDDAILFSIRPATITGVVFREDGLPASGALVSTTTAAGRVLTVQTDNSGAFTLSSPSLKAGTYSLTVSLSGFRPTVVGGIRAEAGGLIDAGRINLSFARNSLAGRVTTADGASAANAIVEVEGAQSTLTGVDEDGTFEVGNLPIGQYSVRARLEAYEEGSTVVQITEARAGDAGTFVLAIDAASLSGTVVGPDAVPVAAVTVAIAGGAVAQTAANGTFSFAGLKTGSYTLTFAKADYRTVTLPGIGLPAGQAVNVGTVGLEYATGSLTGIVSLEDGLSPSGIVVTAEGDSEGRTVTDASGSWSLDGLRTGSYVILAARADYRSESANVDVVANADTAVAPLELPIDPGTITGTVVLADHDQLADVGLTLVTLAQTGATTSPDAGGTFTLSGLRAGTYTVTFALEDYERLERGTVVVIGGSPTNVPEVVLRDLKVPPPPTLALTNAFRPLAGFASVPAILPCAEAAPCNVLPCAAAPPCNVSVDATMPNLGEPDYDANFNLNVLPPLGRWETRVSGTPSPKVWALSEVVRGGVPITFGALPPGLNNLQVRAVDASGNEGTEGELLVFTDFDGPPDQPVFDEPVAGCSPTVGLSLPGVDDAHPISMRRCIVNRDAVNLPLRRVGAPDKTFGCYFLASSPTFDEPCAAHANCDAGARCVSNRCALSAPFLPLAANYDPYSGECYPVGTQYVTVFPTQAAKQIHCLRAYDQAGQASQPACIQVEEDSTEPTQPELFPSDVEVRGETVSLFNLFPVENIDANFYYFETKGSGVGARWRKTSDAERDSGIFTFTLEPGETNELSLRAIDRAGNVGDVVSAFIHETSVAPLVLGPDGIGVGADFSGSRFTWAKPRGCDQFGVTRLCDYDLMIKDENAPDDEPAELGSTAGCYRGCLPGAALEPLTVQHRFGLFYTDYSTAPVPDRHVVKIIPFGPDGQPGTPDDTVLAPDYFTGDASPQSAIVWLGASDNLVVYVRQVTSGMNTDYTAYLVRFTVTPGNGYPVPHATIVSRILASVLTSANTPPTSFSLVGDQLMWVLAGDLYTWARIPTNPLDALAVEPGSEARGVIRMPEREVTDFSRVSVTSDGFSAVIDGAAPSQRLLVVPNFPWRDGDLPGAADCDDATCPPLVNGVERGCFKDQCFNLAPQPTELSCALRTDAAHAACAEQPDPLKCREDYIAICGQVVAITGDGGLGLVTVRASDDEGEDVDRLLLLRGPGSAPTTILERPGPFSSATLNFDRILLSDSSTGTPRLTVVDPTNLSWRGLNPDVNEQRLHPRITANPDGWVAYTRLSGDAAENGLFLMKKDDGSGLQKTLKFPSHANAQGFNVQPWTSGVGYATRGTRLAWVEVLTASGGQQRLRLTVVNTAGCVAGVAGCTTLSFTSLDGLTVRFEVVYAATITVGATLPTFADTGRASFDVALSTTAVMVNSRSGPTVVGVNSSLSYFLRDLNLGQSLDGRVLATRVTGLGMCQVAALSETRLACLNKVGGTWSVSISSRAGVGTAWNAVSVTTKTIGNPAENSPFALGLLAPGGSPHDVFIIDDRTIALESTIGSAAGQSFALVRITPTPPNSLLVGPYDYALIHQRVDLGSHGLGRMSQGSGDRLTFADSVLTLQPEIMRIGVKKGVLERLTYSDAAQLQPAVDSSGAVIWIDERYHLTGQGAYFPRTAFTVRGLP